jgi:glycosyltransferase involved in cell wall biosynthesis
MDQSSPKVSVVIPAYNQAQYLGPAINSVLVQTYHDYEIIVVDDGSTDDTPIIAQQFQDAIHYIRQTNQGLSAARNTAIRKAQADIIALLDSDDLWEPQFLEKMVAHLNNHPEAAAVYCGFQYVDAAGQPVGQPSCKVVLPENFHRTIIFKGNWLVPCAVVFRRRLAEEVGLFEESIGPVADSDLWTKLSARYPLVGLPEVLVKYRRHDSNMTKDPSIMVTANLERISKMFGSSDGNLSSWSELKRGAYITAFRAGSINYLEFGDLSASANYFKQLLEISPSDALSMRGWRKVARAHLPVEHRGDPSNSLDWVLAEKDIFGLLGELSNETNTSEKLNCYYPLIKGSAFLALAEEAFQAKEHGRAYRWLWRIVLGCPRMLLRRPFWGTLARSNINLIKHYSPRTKKSILSDKCNGSTARKV